MKKLLAVILTVTLSFGSIPAKAFFGNPADTMYLAQILAQAIAQLQQLKTILKEGQDSLNLMRDVNAGIFDTLAVLQSVAKNADPGLYGNLKNIEAIARQLEVLYGIATDSPLKATQATTDQAVSEAIAFNNDLYEYTKNLDRIGEEIKSFANTASPGRAQKLTAQSLGVVIHVMNQQLRAQATGLKLQAQNLAIQNKKSKDESAAYMSQTKTIGDQLSSYKFDPQLPRF